VGQTNASRSNSRIDQSPGESSDAELLSWIESSQIPFKVEYRLCHCRKGHAFEMASSQLARPAKKFPISSDRIASVAPSHMQFRRALSVAQRQTTRQCLPFNRSLATLVNRPKLPFDESCASVTPPYEKLVSNLKLVRKLLQTPLTLAEKILYSHLENPESSLSAGKHNIRGQSYLKLNPDRVAMQDASAQMALLQFMASGLDRTAVPSSIHCDHLIVGNKGAKSDLKTSIDQNKEIFDFLESAAKKYGIQFWGPGYLCCRKKLR
jgi:Aconitase family (aconitate hydratase)